MAKRRNERINEVVRRIVAQKIIEDVKDPRIGFTTVTRVEVSDDLMRADVFISVLGTEKEERSTVFILNHMKGFLQRDLGTALQTRVTPVLTFQYDSSTEKALEISQLIEKARGGDSDNVPLESEEISENEDESENEESSLDENRSKSDSSKGDESDI